MGATRIPELESIEFKGARSIAEYSRVARGLGRDMTFEFSSSAEELFVILAAQSGHPLLFGADARHKARRVSRRLQRMAELGQGLATEAVRLNTEFRMQFAEVITPRPKRDKFDFTDDK